MGKSNTLTITVALQPKLIYLCRERGTLSVQREQSSAVQPSYPIPPVSSLTLSNILCFHGKDKPVNAIKAGGWYI
jgi:hypothetical protein